MIKKYCKAYHVKDIRQFPGWSESHTENDPELTDDDIVYLWDNFTVVRDPIISDRSLIFDRVSPAWQAFCREHLRFGIPQDLRYAYE